MRFLVQLLPQPFVPRSKKREVWSLGEGNTDLKSSDLRRTISVVVYFPKRQLPPNGLLMMVSFWFYHSSKNEGSLNTRGLGNFSGSSILAIIRTHYFWEISSDVKLLKLIIHGYSGWRICLTSTQLAFEEIYTLKDKTGGMVHGTGSLRVYRYSTKNRAKTIWGWVTSPIRE